MARQDVEQYMKDKTTHFKIAIRDLSIVVAVTILVVSYYFRGPPSGADVTMHLSRARIIMSSFPNLPRWNPYWYFGIPFLRTYPGLFHYSLAGLGIVLSFVYANLPINVLLSLTIMLYTYLIFLIGAISMYFLAREIGLSSFGAISSAILFITSYNLYAFWSIGSFPNITSLLISPLPLALYLRGVKKRRLRHAFPIGLTYGLVLLFYLSNAIYLSVFFVFLSILMMIREPELLFIRRMGNEPPKYTLTLFKIAALSALSAIAFSAWWLFPFYTSIRMSSSSYSASLSIVKPSTVQASLLKFFSWLIGIESPSLITSGFGHFILTIIAAVFSVKFRRTPATDGVFASLFAFFLCFTPWLGFTFSILPINRPPLFFSLFSSLAGGFALSVLLQSYSKTMKLNDFRTDSFKAILIILLGSSVLLSAISPTILLTRPFPASKIPPWNDLLDKKVKLGERMGLDGGYDLNLVSNVWQSGGGSIESMYIVNEFAYTFWYYIPYKKDSRYLPYFSRNYNVKYINGLMMQGLNKTDVPGLYEVKNFNSSIVEVIPQNCLFVLHIGSSAQYTRLFISTALSGDVEPILVDGGIYLEDFTVDDLRHFDLIYISELKTRDEEKYLGLIRSYLQNGGTILFDIGKTPSQLSQTLTNILPVEKVSEKKSNLQLVLSPIFDDVKNFSFKETKDASISYAEKLKEGAEVVVWEDGNPVIVRIKEYDGWIVWSGLNLPYQVMLRQDDEGARLMVKLMRFLSSRTEDSNKRIRYADLTAISTDEYIISITNPSIDDSVWFKMTYYPGWEAIIQESGEKLKIFLAGPHTMLVFPEKSSSLKITFRFGKTADVILGESISIAFLIIFFTVSVIHPLITKFWRVPQGWIHTHHKGTYQHLAGKRKKYW